MVTTALLSHPASTAAYFLLMTAIASLWLSSRFIVWASLLSAAMLAAFVAGRIGIIGIFEAVLFALICFSFYRLSPNSLTKGILGLVLFICAFLLGSHKLPGFKNWLVLPSFALSRDSLPIQLYLNFDKPLIGLCIVAFGIRPARTIQQWKLIFKTALPIIFWTSCTLLGLALVAGYVSFDFKWFEFSWLWFLVNLLFTCVAEEAFFRGFLQGNLAEVLGRRDSLGRFGAVGAWIIASVLFGLVHLAGGWAYACLAAVAGLFYGYAYLKTQKIEASILVHFSLNAIHFLAFTYPAFGEVR